MGICLVKRNGKTGSTSLTAQELGALFRFVLISVWLSAHVYHYVAVNCGIAHVFSFSFFLSSSNIIESFCPSVFVFDACQAERLIAKSFVHIVRVEIHDGEFTTLRIAMHINQRTPVKQRGQVSRVRFVHCNGEIYAPARLRAIYSVEILPVVR